jgi:tetratricopeptide (TPR) repeat protein
VKAKDRARIEPDFNSALDLWHGGDGRAAIEILERLASEYPDQPAILGMLGAISRSLRDYERAVDYYQQTTALSPRSELASLGLFHSLWQVGRRDEAMDEMARFLTVAPSEEYNLLMKESLGEVED